MPCCRNATIVTEFLRDALARGDVGVTKLEIMARTAGLLGQDQRITHSKLFKGAKKTLGIRSRRTGFGPRSQWLWRLPRQSETSIKTEEGQGPGAAPERRLPIPIEWVEGIASLKERQPPSDVPRHRWRQFVEDCRSFLGSSNNWAGRAAKLGWDATGLFGCASTRPLDYSGCAGLLWAITQRIFYRRNVDAAKVTLPWIKFGSRNR
jgi:hypothetical protein